MAGGGTGLYDYNHAETSGIYHESQIVFCLHQDGGRDERREELQRTALLSSPLLGKSIRLPGPEHIRTLVP